MEKTSLTVSMEAERMEALAFYLQKEKTSSLQKELGKMIEELYEKTVPADVREYLEGRAKKTAPPKTRVRPPARAEDHAARADEED